MLEEKASLRIQGAGASFGYTDGMGSIGESVK